SDVEDGPENSVTLAQDYVGRNNAKDEQRAVRLMELGPRMELKLMKVESALCEGEVIYHSYVKKTAEEIELAEKRRQANLSRQALRRQQQQENVERKKEKAAREKAARNNTARNLPVNDDDADADYESDYESVAGDDSDRDAGKVKAPGRRAADDFGAEAVDEDLDDESDGDVEMGDSDGSDSDDDQPPPSSGKRPRSKAGSKKK
ncbi:rRNA-binding ribosome biosynthesis protein, partial [Coemansia spiralis]